MDFNSYEILERIYFENPEQICITDKETDLTYREMYCQINHMTQALRRLGAKKGQRIACIEENSAKTVVLCLSAFRLGAVFAPLNPHADDQTLRRMLQTVRPDFLFLGKEHGSFRNFQSPGSMPNRVITFGGDIPDTISWDYLVSHSQDAFYCEDLSFRDPCAVLFSNSQEHSPRASVFCIGGLLSHIKNLKIGDMAGQENASTLVSISFSSAIGFCAVLSNIHFRIRTVFLCPFRPVTWMQTVRQIGVQNALLSPPQLQDLLLEVSEAGKTLESLKSVRILGDELSTALLADAFRFLPDSASIINIYYTTETFVLSKMRWTSRSIEECRRKNYLKLCSIGKSGYGNELQIDAENGAGSGRIETGEFLVRRPEAFLGYLNPFTTRTDEFGEEWFRTGDIGYRDGDENLYFAGKALSDGQKSLEKQSFSAKTIVPLNYDINGTIPLKNSGLTADRELSRKIEQVLSLALKLYSILDLEQLKACYLENIPDIIPASACSFLALNGKNRNILTRIPSLSNSGSEEIKWNRVRIPRLLGAMNGHPDKAESRDLLNLLFPSNTLKPEDAAYVITFPIMGSQRVPLCLLSFARSREEGDLTAAETAAMQVFSNLFCVAVKNALEYSRLREEKDTLQKTLYETSSPLILTDESGNFTFCSKSAESFLADTPAGEGILRKLQTAIRNSAAKLNKSGASSETQILDIVKGGIETSFHVQTSPVQDMPNCYFTLIYERWREPHLETFKVKLTDREREIISLIVKGYSNREISDELCITLSTVKFHVKNILKKFGVSSRSELLIRLYNGEPGTG